MSQQAKSPKEQEDLNVKHQKRRKSKNHHIKHQISVNRTMKRDITERDTLPTNTEEAEATEEAVVADIQTVKEAVDIIKAKAEAGIAIRIEAVVVTIKIEAISSSNHIIRRDTLGSCMRTLTRG
jgi:Fe-S cluster assembly scaffold protein SufB